VVLSAEGSVSLCLPSRKQVKGELEGLCSSSQPSANELCTGTCRTEHIVLL